MNNYVSSGFLTLDACETTIRKSNVPARKVSEHLLRKVLFNDEYGFTCSTHEASICAKDIRVIVNVFNNQRKYLTESVVNDRVIPFKKLERTNLVLVLHSLFCYDERKLQYALYFELNFSQIFFEMFTQPQSPLPPLPHSPNKVKIVFFILF